MRLQLRQRRHQEWIWDPRKQRSQQKEAAMKCHNRRDHLGSDLEDRKERYEGDKIEILRSSCVNVKALSFLSILLVALRVIPSVICALVAKAINIFAVAIDLLTYL
jgi:hypothetical protein